MRPISTCSLALATHAVAVALVSVALPGRLTAQRPAVEGPAAHALRPIPVGVTVRVLAPTSAAPGPAAWRQGLLLAVDSASVAVERRDGARYTIPRALVRQVEVRQRRVSAERVLGSGALGGLIGALAGALILRTIDDSPNPESKGTSTMVGFVLGGGLGLVSGAVIGASTGGGRWVPARLPEPATSVVPGGTPPAS